MTKLSVLCFTLLVVLQDRLASAWTTSHPVATFPFRSTNGATTTSSPTILRDQGGVEAMSVEQLDNHEEEGTKMAESIVKWLDKEWMPQEVHVRMAETAKESYIKCRRSGDADVMSIMTTVADDLTEKWDEYDADAFINAWDISNYVSDYLYLQANGEKGCDCSTDIH